MRLKFVVTKELKTYLAKDVRCYKGSIVDVPPHRGKQLLETYPHNFHKVELKDQEPALDEIIEIFDTPSEGLRIVKLYVTKNRKLKVDYQI